MDHQGGVQPFPLRRIGTEKLQILVNIPATAAPDPGGNPPFDAGLLIGINYRQTEDCRKLLTVQIRQEILCSKQLHRHSIHGADNKIGVEFDCCCTMRYLYPQLD